MSVASCTKVECPPLSSLCPGHPGCVSAANSTQRCRSSRWQGADHILPPQWYEQWSHFPQVGLQYCLGSHHLVPDHEWCCRKSWCFADWWSGRYGGGLLWSKGLCDWCGTACLPGGHPSLVYLCLFDGKADAAHNEKTCWMFEGCMVAAPALVVWKLS